VSPAWTEKIRPLFEVVSRDLSGFRPIEDQDPGSRAGLTVQTLKVFASSMAAFPGRKNLVWITHGVPSAVPGIDEGEMIDLSPQIRRLGEALVQANIALYPVAQPASGVRAPMGLDILQLLSGLTGGRAYSSDSVGRAITEARTDARGSYVVGYYPRRQKDDGKHHSFRVTCARKGVRLRTQQGYWAFPMQSSTDEREQAAFEAAAARRFDDSRIGLRGTISLFGGPVRTVRFQIKVDSADLLLTNQNDRYYVDIALELVAYSADGAVQHVTTTPLQLSLTQEQVQQVSKEGIEVMRDLPLDGSTEKIRLVIFDRGSNVTGSVTIPMAVADMNPEGPSSGKSSGKEERRQSAER
jgi:hypothetical protein